MCGIFQIATFGRRYCWWKISGTTLHVWNPVKQWDTYHVDCRVSYINSIFYKPIMFDIHSLNFRVASTKIWSKHVYPPILVGWRAVFCGFFPLFQGHRSQLTVLLAGFREQTERPNSFDHNQNCKTWKTSIFVSIGCYNMFESLHGT